MTLVVLTIAVIKNADSVETLIQIKENFILQTIIQYITWHMQFILSSGIIMSFIWG